MTDTPRTEEELLTIFEDGQIGTIAAQDMRDMVVSARAGKLDKTQAFSLYAYGQSIAVPTNTGFNLPFDPDNAMYTGTQDLNDPNGYVTTSADDPDPYYGLDGGFYLKGLEPNSVWCLQLSCGFAAGTFAPEDGIQVVAPVVGPNYPGDTDPDDAGGIFGAPTYAYTAVQAMPWNAGTHGAMYSGIATLPLYADDRFDLWNLLAGYIYQNSGDTQTLVNVEYDMWRIR